MFITGQFECYGTIELRQAWLLPIKILKLSSNIVKTLSTLQFFYDCSTLLKLPNSTVPWKFQYIRLLILTEMWKNNIHVYTYVVCPHFTSFHLSDIFVRTLYFFINMIFQKTFLCNFHSMKLAEYLSYMELAVEYLWLKFFDLS